MSKDALEVLHLYAGTDERKIDSFNKNLKSKMDVRIESDKPVYESEWIEMMEFTLPYIENTLNAPTRLIVNEEEVLNIEKIKKVSVESIKHLSKHTSLINDVNENGDVEPGRLLNVFKEETLNTYENRFIYTLIGRMLTAIRKEKNRLKAQTRTPVNEIRRLDYKGSCYTNKQKVDVQILLSSTSESSGLTDDKKDELERMKMLEKNLVALTFNSTYVTLDKLRVPLVSPPLKKTNALLKNVNFQYAVKLWDYMIDNMDKEKEAIGVTTQCKEYKDKGKNRKYIDETFLLDYLIMQSIDDPVLAKKYKREILEQLIASVVEKTIDVDEDISEEQLKDLVAKQYTITKYRRQVTNKDLQEIFKQHISKYVNKISE